MLLPISRRAALSRLALGSASFWAPLSLSTAAAAATTLSSLPPLQEQHKRLYLIRHGETDWNAENRIQGSTDKKLNAIGLGQAEALRSYLAAAPLDLIASSNLSRAAQTADAVAASHPSARRIPGQSAFAEMCFGDFEGLRLEEFDAEYKAFLKAWRNGENSKAFPGYSGECAGESPNDVAKRGLDGLRSLGVLPGGSLASGVRGTERHVLVAAHGRFNKILIAALKGDVSTASDVEQGNTAINILDLTPEGGVVARALNLREHLQPAAAAAG